MKRDLLDRCYQVIGHNDVWRSYSLTIGLNNLIFLKVYANNFFSQSVFGFCQKTPATTTSKNSIPLNPILKKTIKM